MTLEEKIEQEKLQIEENTEKLICTVKSNNQHDFNICMQNIEEHEQLTGWLEELKTIKEMDLSIPQHFTKEQSDWIKAYCIRRNLEFYNKAIDDFTNEIINSCNSEEFMNRFNPVIAIIVERLKKKANK